MKVLSFNARIWTRDTDCKSENYWKSRMKKMEQMITELNPDVLCFQEFMFPATLYVPSNYKKVNPLSIHHHIYVKKGVKTADNKFLIHMDAATIKMGGLRVINVHSHWNQDIIKKNCEQIEELANKYTQVVSCGDFNNFEDAINLPTLTHVPLENEQDTFINFTRPTESHGIIDHFYVNGIKGPKARVVTEYGTLSDHFPILLEF